MSSSFSAAARIATGAALLLASASYASALPAPVFSGSYGTSYFDESTFLYTSSAGTPGPSGTKGGSASTSSSLTWSSSLGLDPTISASASVSSGNLFEGASANINLILDYYMVPVGPLFTQVPVIVTGSGAVSATNTPFLPQAGLGVFPVGPPLGSQPAVIFAGYHDWTLNTTVLLLAGQMYDIELSVQINIGSAGDGTITSSAMVDPMFTIDPSFPNANLYHLEFSPGIGAATPLPASLPLFVSGLAGLGLLARRRAKRTAA